MDMKTFQVRYTVTIAGSMDVEAENAADAKAQVESAADFPDVEYPATHELVDWEATSAVEVDG